MQIVAEDRVALESRRLRAAWYCTTAAMGGR